MADEKLEHTVTRHIAAPPAAVWQFMTLRQEEWWCPVPWRAEVIKQDWHPGGEMTGVVFTLDAGMLAGRDGRVRHHGFGQDDDLALGARIAMAQAETEQP